MSFPACLHALSIISLVIACSCAAIIAAHEIMRPQPMWIMNLVWPLTALFSGVIWLVFYWRAGRSATHQAAMPIAVAKSTNHCGAGCVLGDIIAEWLVFAAPSIAVVFGWKSLFREEMIAVWIPDYIVAFGLGIAFQYFTIKPMRDLSVREGLLAAVKSDAVSITAWQIGMYGAMAVIQLLWFRPTYGEIAAVDTPEFWFAMQIAMVCGFCTAYPANWLLVKVGLKEKM